MQPSPFTQLGGVQRSWERHWGWALGLPSVPMLHYPQITPGGSRPPGWSAAWPEPLSVKSVMGRRHTHRAGPQCRPRQPLASSFLYVTTASSPRERLCDCGTSEGCRNVPRTAFSEDRGAGGPLALLQLASRTGGAESTGWGPKTQAQIVPSWKGPVWKVCPVPHDTDLARLAL